jgi:hypothetical protein
LSSLSKGKGKGKRREEKNVRCINGGKEKKKDINKPCA